MSENSTAQLEDLIRDFIRYWYEAEYMGLIRVEKLNPGYECILGIPSYMAQTSLAIDCDTDEEFLNYVFAELRSRNYVRQDVYKVLRNSQTREE